MIGGECIPAQIRENHPMDMIGEPIRMATTRWWVRYRSKIGAVIMAATRPAMISEPPW